MGRIFSCASQKRAAVVMTCGTPSIAAVLLLAPSALGGTLPQETNERSRVLLEFKVNTLYDDSPTSVRVIQELIEVLPPTVLRDLPVEGGVPRLIEERYAITRETTPLTHDLLEEYIVDVNILQEELLLPSELLVPTLPRRTDRGGVAEAPALPVVQELPEPVVIQRPAKLRPVTAFDRLPRIVQPRRHSNEVILEWEVADSIAVSLSRDEDLVRTLNMRAPTGPLVVEYADRQALQARPTSEGVLTEKERRLLDSLLTSVAIRSVPVFILDSGWPTESAFDRSYRTLSRMLQIVRDCYNLGPSDLGGPTPGFVPPSNPHALHIHDALVEFERLDVLDQIQVVYVPLTRDQGAGSLLRELLEVHFLARRVRDNSVDSGCDDADHGGALLSQADRQHAADLAASELARLPETAEDQSTVRTSKAILDALWDIADTAADADNFYYFINLSWRVKDKVVLVEIPGVPKGLAVVAVGNVPGQNVHAEEIDFAQRVAHTLYFATVLNMDRSTRELKCGSSTIDTVLVDDALAVGFDGESQSGCKTSFASPRVAWLLAVGEAVRQDTVESQHWASRLESGLLRLRPPNEAGIRSLWFDAAAYLTSEAERRDP